MYRLPPSLESNMILHFTVCTLSTPLARGSINSQIAISHVHKCSTSAIDSHSHSNAYPFITWMERSNEGKIPCSLKGMHAEPGLEPMTSAFLQEISYSMCCFTSGTCNRCGIKYSTQHTSSLLKAFQYYSMFPKYMAQCTLIVWMIFLHDSPA